MADEETEREVDLFSSNATWLIWAIEGFTPLLAKLQEDFEESGGDWPTVILATMAHVNAISLLYILPRDGTMPIDRRTMASLTRNMIETYDVFDMMVNWDTPDEFNLNRDILGHYITHNINKVQKKIKPEKVQEIYKVIRAKYRSDINDSSLDRKAVRRIKSGETIFYRSRADRIRRACGKYADLVGGIINDINTYVHSVPPSAWISTLDEIFGNKGENRDFVSVWLRIHNYYYALLIKSLLSDLNLSSENDNFLAFLKEHETVFSTS